MTDTTAPALDLLVIGIDSGALTDAPVWETHKRGRNWAAKIKVAPQQPGGLDRSFLIRAHGGSFYYMADGLAPGDAVEFGADYYTSSGKKMADRWYGVVLDISDSELTLARIRGGITAAKKAIETLKAYRQSQELTEEKPDLDALAQEKASLLRRVAEIDAILNSVPPSTEQDNG